MRTVEILIVENDLLVAEDTALRIQKLGYQISGTAASADEAFTILEKTSPDIVLMDIDIDGDMDGVELAAKINQRKTTPIIYLTELNDPRTLNRTQIIFPALYMNKPFNEHLLSYNIELAISNWLNDQEKQKFDGLEEAIFLRANMQSGKKVRVELEDIYFIKAARSYCEIYAIDRNRSKANKLEFKKYEPASSMSDVSKLLTPTFIQVHRSYVVNLKYLGAVYEDDLMIGEVRIPIGRSFKGAVKKRLKLI